MSETCPLCKSNVDSCSKLGSEFHIFKCTGCKIQFLSPQPSEEILDGLYSSQYFLAGDDPSAQEKMWGLKQKTARLYLENIMRLVHTGASKLLEIGCGTGDFLLEAQTQGFEVYGVEVSTSAAEIANKKLKSTCVHQGISGFQSESFDVIALFDVIEHLRDPFSYLDHINGLLKPGSSFPKSITLSSF